MEKWKYFAAGCVISTLLLLVVFYAFPYKRMKETYSLNTYLLDKLDGYKVRLSELEKTSYAYWGRVTSLQDSVEILDNSRNAQEILISQLQKEKNAVAKFDYHHFTDVELSDLLTERYTKKDSLR